MPDKHDKLALFQAQRYLQSISTVQRQVDKQADQVLAHAVWVREVNGELQQHQHAVLVVGQQRFAPVVFGKLVEEFEDNLSEGRVLYELQKYRTRINALQISSA